MPFYDSDPVFGVFTFTPPEKCVSKASDTSKDGVELDFAVFAAKRSYSLDAKGKVRWTEMEDPRRLMDLFARQSGTEDWYRIAYVNHAPVEEAMKATYMDGEGTTLPRILDVTQSLLETAKLRQVIEVKTKAKLWGEKEHDIVPVLLDKVFGDGAKLARVSTINSRPDHYVVRVDSSCDVEDEGYNKATSLVRFDQVLVAEAIEEQFGSCYDGQDPDKEHASSRKFVIRNEQMPLNVCLHNRIVMANF